MLEVKNIIARIDAEIAQTIKGEPEELRLLRTGTGADVGSYGQYFGTLDIGGGILRDYACYTLYGLVKMARSGDLNAAQMRRLFTEFDPGQSGFLGYVGLRKLGNFAAELKHAFDTASLEEIALGLAALNRYANRLAAWAHHYFPWNLGKQFQYPSSAPEDKSYYDRRPDPNQPIGDKRLRLTWEPLGISVILELATFKNPELCKDVWDAAPFRVNQEHACVSGKSMYAWTPALSTAPVKWKEIIREAPFGRVRFSQGTGQKLIVQYGPTTEDIATPVLGQIAGADLDKLPTVGAAVWDAMYNSKEVVWLKVEHA